MTPEDLWSAVRLAWQMAPFPFLFVVVIAVAFAWLWIEYQATRLLRATPGWRRPPPLMPGISVVSVAAIRVLWALLWVWLVLFVALVVAMVLARSVEGVPMPLVNGVLSAGRAWNQGYRLLTDRLPEGAPSWLRPASADLSWLTVPTFRNEPSQPMPQPLAAESVPLPAPTPIETSAVAPAAASIDLAPTFTPTALPLVTVVILRNANVREKPSTSAPLLGIARAGRTYVVTGRNAASTWVRIDFAGADGWVFAELVQVEGSLEEVSATAE